jgi:hypothetical protein
MSNEHESEASYESPIPNSLNVRFVTNHIVIDRDVEQVYPWVTTWNKLSLWLQRAARFQTLKGKNGAPAELGDVLIERFGPAVLPAGEVPSLDVEVPRIFTVVARIPGKLWVVAGQDAPNEEPEGRTKYVSTFSTFALPERRTLFSRVFHSIDPGGGLSAPDTGHGSKIIQPALEVLKERIESEIPAV